jgi:proline dehydrogenase
VRSFLLFLARQESLKNFMMHFKIFRKTAWRFVAGETIEDAVRAAREANLQGIKATMDLLGENTLSREDAFRTTEEILGMMDRIHAEKVDCNVSIKLTQLGLGLGTDFCHQNLTVLLRRAAELGSFIRVDMEDSNFTQRTLDVVIRAHATLGNVGTVIQSYLFRSEQDVRMLIGNRIGIRLCKGAYLEPATIAFRKKRDNDANYVKLMKLLLQSGLYHGIATHDEDVIADTKNFAKEKAISRESFEFQMLYGIRRDLQQKLVQDGYNVRVYIPYGKRWYPYFMRRLAERPANLLFILRNLFRG